jgi:hypothetical protein
MFFLNSSPPYQIRRYDNPEIHNVTIQRENPIFYLG